MVNIDTVEHKLLLVNAYINPDAVFDAVNSRYVVPVRGIYRYSAYAQIDNGAGSSANMQTYLNVYVNGSEVRGTVGTLENANSDRWFPSFTGLIQVEVNDQVELWAKVEDSINASYVTYSHAVLSMELVKQL